MKKNYKWCSFLHLTPGWQTNWWFYCVDKVIDILSCELEVAHRYLEGKYEALKILQGKVKQHTHTRTALTRVIIVAHWQKSLLKVKSALLHLGHSWQGHKSHQKSVAKKWGEGQSTGKGKFKRRLLVALVYLLWYGTWRKCHFPFVKGKRNVQYILYMCLCVVEEYLCMLPSNDVTPEICVCVEEQYLMFIDSFIQVAWLRLYANCMLLLC